MPLFALVSGYLFYISYKRRTIKEILCKRIVGLLQPLLIWGSLYYISYQILLKILEGNMTLSIKEWWITISGPFFWFLWSMMVSSICVLVSEYVKKYSIVCMIIMFALVSIFPNGEYTMFVYPFFVCGVVGQKYKEKISKYINSYIEWGIIAVFIILLFFYEEKHYIYTTGISLFTLERSWLEQLGIDCFRYMIGLLGSLSVIILTKKGIHRFPKNIKKVLALCGKKSLEIYILQCIIVSWIFSMFYSNISLRVGVALRNIMIIDLFVAPLTTIAFVMLIILLIKILGKSRKLNQILFCR